MKSLQLNAEMSNPQNLSQLFRSYPLTSIPPIDHSPVRKHNVDMFKILNDKNLVHPNKDYTSLAITLPFRPLPLKNLRASQAKT